MEKFTPSEEKFSFSKNKQTVRRKQLGGPSTQIIRNILNYSSAAYIRKSSLIGGYLLLMN